MRAMWLVTIALLTGCASGMEPISDPVFIQGFTITNVGKTVVCMGSYSRPTLETDITTDITCDGGLTGRIAIKTLSNGHPTVATASISNGTVAQARFKPILGDRHAYGDIVNVAVKSPSPNAKVKQAPRMSTRAQTSSSASRWSSSRRYYRGPRGGCYYINSNGNKTYVDGSYCR